MLKLSVPIFLATVLSICNSSFAQDFTEAEYISKIITAEEQLQKNPSDEAFNNWFDIAHEAYELYPDSLAIASHWSYPATQKRIDPITGIKILLPFIKDNNQSNELPYALWRIFYYGYVNTRFNGPRYLDGYWNHVLKNDLLTPEESLNLLTGYWSNKINIDSLSIEYRERYRDAIVESRLLFTPDQESQAVHIWQKAIDNIEAYARLRASIDATMAAQRERGERLLQEDAERKEKRRAAFEQALPGFDLLLTQPNDYMKILEVFSKFINFGKELREYPDIPNYQKLKAEFVDSEEAEVLNIAYKVYLRREFREALAAIGQLETADSDTRLLWYRIYCLSELKEQPAAILPYLEKLLQLTPGDLHAQAMKQHLEKELEAANEL